MTKETAIKLFEQKQIRSLWNEDDEKWYFSIVDVVQVLTESTIPKRYWTDLKKKLKLVGSEMYDNLVQLKMQSE
ncbi:hypothetical protein [Flavobacterium sp.]|uniref:hypothetical protein n=1 Tax=Flavobacterium sp. TaxID=239 RepID=UPI0025CCDFF7|nr:hypothetical protein [Flavobacterium sp.]